MKDKDAKLLEEAYENLFAGIVEDEDEDKKTEDDDSDEKDDDEDDSDSSDDDSTDDSDDDDDKDDSDSDDSESNDDSDNPYTSNNDDSDTDSDEDSKDDENGEDSEDSSEGGGDVGITSKIKTLQKQYNDLLIDAFEKYAPECIEMALSEAESSFGEDIEPILDNALQDLKSKILGDLGVDPIEQDGLGDLGSDEVPHPHGDEISHGDEITPGDEAIVFSNIN